ncbi:sulfite exporter TauE/SafE family protein [Virgibacillus sp. MG-45]|uniref:sulfite exporter TauE/SafE family protein n=1 Tax=Virgibacillus sp. MG-45 TaxID=3102791 RepID=UPI002EDB7A3E
MNSEIIFIGFFVGGLVGMTGVGGASLLTPTLLFIGVPPTTAIGTDFIYNALTKLVGTIHHIRLKTVNFRLVGYLALGSIPGAMMANFLFYVCLAPYYNEAFILQLLGFLLIIVSIIPIIQLIYGRTSPNIWQCKTIEEKKYITIASGFVIGVVVGITSIGAGSLFGLFLLYFFQMKPASVVGTDITHAFILATMSGLLMAGYGHVDYFLAGNLLCGSIPGVIIGSKLSTIMPSSTVRIIILSIILITGCKLVLNG